jgi:hypothetical protein
LDVVWNYIPNRVLLKILKKLLKIIFLFFSYRFDVLMSKNKKKYYLNAFLNKKHFEKQHLPHSQTSL